MTGPTKVRSSNRGFDPVRGFGVFGDRLRPMLALTVVRDDDPHLPGKTLVIAFALTRLQLVVWMDGKPLLLLYLNQKRLNFFKVKPDYISTVHKSSRGNFINLYWGNETKRVYKNRNQNGKGFIEYRNRR
ncbi:hypothetical protein OSB04_002022 [Centaurea solstitialis]|uniref:Uncharacterized protein n=1 Tax=Centaurea solstitialis TaxID=347529 RepID=A0AA38U4Q4_9ASTR|nr:hypothetical protein OSB04_002022 [Centaurea solstitialis]